MVVRKRLVQLFLSESPVGEMAVLVHLWRTIPEEVEVSCVEKVQLCLCGEQRCRCACTCEKDQQRFQRIKRE